MVIAVDTPVAAMPAERVDLPVASADMQVLPAAVMPVERVALQLLEADSAAAVMPVAASAAATVAAAAMAVADTGNSRFFPQRGSLASAGGPRVLLGA
jgi:hypothetical protein